MTDPANPASTDDPAGTDDPTDSALSAAGRRLRQQAPDEIAARQALARVTLEADAPPPQRRSWWPALIGAGLAAAAIVGAIAIRADDTETLTPATSPDQTTDIESEPTDPPSQLEPTTTPVPNTTGPGPTGASLVVDGACITVTTTAGSATGCPLVDAQLDHLEQRTFVADLDGPVVITSGSTNPLTDLTATIDTGSFASRCQWDDLAPRIADGDLVEVAVCNDTGVMGATTGRVGEQDRSISYFTLPTPYLPDGAELGPGTAIDGMPRALAFTADAQDIVTCSLVLVPDRSGWKEACGTVYGLAVETALVQLDPAEPSLYEVSIDAAGLITSARELAAMAPSSGCSIDSSNDILRATLASSIVMGIGCIDDKAALTTASVLTQEGPPDGSIWTALRDGDVWSITDSGTGIETLLSFPVAPFSTWSQWPVSTVPGFRSYLWEPIVSIDTQATVDSFADELLATLGALAAEPEFPLNERLVAVQPDGLPLIVAQIDIGGDDSVAGAMIYVWLDEQFDDSGPIGWRAGEVISGEVCARGGSAGRDLCI